MARDVGCERREAAARRGAGLLSVKLDHTLIGGEPGRHIGDGPLAHSFRACLRDELLEIGGEGHVLRLRAAHGQAEAKKCR